MGNTGSTVASLVEGSASCQSRGSIMTMLPGSSPGSTLSNPAGVIKPGRTVLVVLVGVVWAWGSGQVPPPDRLQGAGISTAAASAWGSPRLVASYRCAKNCGELRYARQQYLGTWFPASTQGGHHRGCKGWRRR